MLRKQDVLSYVPLGRWYFQYKTRNLVNYKVETDILSEVNVLLLAMQGVHMQQYIKVEWAPFIKDKDNSRCYTLQ